jgi:SAM-dependent methyltransferase
MSVEPIRILQTGELSGTEGIQRIWPVPKAERLVGMALRDIQEPSILVVGCGGGAEDAVNYAQRFKAEVIGVDFDQKAIKEVKEGLVQFSFPSGKILAFEVIYFGLPLTEAFLRWGFHLVTFIVSLAGMIANAEVELLIRAGFDIRVSSRKIITNIERGQTDLHPRETLINLQFLAEKPPI